MSTNSSSTPLASFQVSSPGYPNSTIVTGWVQQPDGRGTIDIIYSSLTTVILCSWSVLCVNIPSAHHKPWKRFMSKLWLAAITLAAPELLVQLAMGQRRSARASVKQFKSMENTDWSIVHAFYADMGGFILESPDMVPFPLTARQLHYLVEKGYIEYPKQITREAIENMNQKNAVVRGLTICQALWYFVNAMSRFAAGLHTTTLELTTLAIITNSVAASYYWAHKPADVSQTVTIKTTTSIQQIRQDAGLDEPYDVTPVDFIDRDDREWTFNIYYDLGCRILAKTGLNLAPRSRPIQYIRNDNFPRLDFNLLPPLLIFHIFFVGIHMFAWRFQFPSKPEQILWQVSVMVVLAEVLLADTLELWFRYMPEELEVSGNRKLHFLFRKRAKGLFRLITFQKEQPCKHHNLSDLEIQLVRYGEHPDSDDAESNLTLAQPSKAPPPPPPKDQKSLGTMTYPRAKISGRLITMMFGGGFFYLLGRGYIWFEDFYSLRELPASAFQTVGWSNNLPHV
jgi:hypothetical protein